MFRTVCVATTVVLLLSSATRSESAKTEKAKPSVICVTGRVLDQQGKPVSGAIVSQGIKAPRVHRFREGKRKPNETDPSGCFALAGVKVGTAPINVMIEGSTVIFKEIDVRLGMKPIEIRVGENPTIFGQVRNKKDVPVPNVTVFVDIDGRRNTKEASLETDDEGRFVLGGVSDRGASFSFLPDGYSFVRRDLKPAKNVQIVTLFRPLRISGTVVDAKTGEPITQYRIVPLEGGSGAARRSESVLDDAHFEISSEGRYEIRLEDSEPFALRGAVRTFRFCIEAEDHVTFTSRAFRADEERAEYDVKLRPGRWIVGNVRSPNGKALGNALVVLVAPKAHVRIENRRLSDMPNKPSWCRTKSDGRFSFPNREGVFHLVVMHDTGQRILRTSAPSTAEPLNVVVEAWGRVEGVVRIGAKPAARRKVLLRVLTRLGKKEGLVHHDCETTSDENGRFAFTHVLPGKGHIGYQPKPSLRAMSSTHDKHVTVKSGQTAKVTVGGDGRPIIGRIILPPGTKDVIWNTYNNEIRPNGDPPGEDESASRDDDDRHGIALQIKPDGSLRAEDVPAGKYILVVCVNRKRPGAKEWLDPDSSSELGSILHEFEVPEMPGGRSDEPLDLGRLTLVPRKRLEPGDAAPPLPPKTLDRKAIKLSDFRGKAVLLHFWSYLRPEEIKQLRAIDNAFGSNDRFAMVGVAFASEKSAKRQVEKAGFSWPHIAIICYKSKLLRQSYGLPVGSTLEQFPAVLVGPDGKVLRVIEDHEKLHKAVEEAIKTTKR